MFSAQMNMLISYELFRRSTYTHWYIHICVFVPETADTYSFEMNLYYVPKQTYI